MTLSLLILVPARGGSKRLPGKNLKQLGGKSLIAHTVDAIAQSGLQAPLLLSTDDSAIAEEGRRLGMLVPFRRPDALSGDGATTASVVLHALDWYRADTGADPDTVMVLQPTSPFRGGNIMRAALDMLARRPDADSIVAMTANHLPADKIFYADEAGCAIPVGQEARRPVYQPNGSLYLVRCHRLREEGTLYAGNILPCVSDPLRGLDIDTLEEWKMAEALLASGLPPERQSFSAGPSLVEHTP
jgi:CMP-N-acetylneuraminic acid synthetase